MNLSSDKSLGQENIIRLYHGSPFKEFTPACGKGKDQHDYGRGFYLTPDKELAKEWARCRGIKTPGWLHTFELDCTGLCVYDFETLPEKRGFYWVSELLKHRVEEDREALLHNIYYDDYSEYLCKMFPTSCEHCDVVRGWRADDSYFQLALHLLEDHWDVSLFEELFELLAIGTQICCKSEKAFRSLTVTGAPELVSDEYALRYAERDASFLDDAMKLLHSKRNKFILDRRTMRDLVTTYLEEGGKL